MTIPHRTICRTEEAAHFSARGLERLGLVVVAVAPMPLHACRSGFWYVDTLTAEQDAENTAQGDGSLPT